MLEIWPHLATFGHKLVMSPCHFCDLWSSLVAFQERDGMKVMDEGEVGEIVQGGVQVGIGNLSRRRLSSTHLPDLQQSNVRCKIHCL